MVKEWVAKFEKPKGDPSAYLKPATTVLSPYLKVSNSENSEAPTLHIDSPFNYFTTWKICLLLDFLFSLLKVPIVTFSTVWLSVF